MGKRKLTTQRDKQVGNYQWRYGARPQSNWGMGDLLAPYAEGDVVFVPPGAVAFSGRIPHTWSPHPGECQPGLYRVTSAFSVGPGDEWYFRVCPIIDGVTMYDNSSDRIHMIPGHCNYAEGWELVESADPDNVRKWDHPYQLELFCR